jgi:hypothetical protein
MSSNKARREKDKFGEAVYIIQYTTSDAVSNDDARRKKQIIWIKRRIFSVWLGARNEGRRRVHIVHND